MNFNKNAGIVLNKAEEYALTQKKEIFELWHLEKALMSNETFKEIFLEYFEESLYDDLMIEIESSIYKIREISPSIVNKYQQSGDKLPIRTSFCLLSLFPIAAIVALDCGKNEIGITHLFDALTSCEFCQTEGVLFNLFDEEDEDVRNEFIEALRSAEFGDSEEETVNNTGLFGLPIKNNEEMWKEYSEDLIERAKTYNKPFVGREDVTETTIRVLARMDKCNPVHVGEPGVGKTAITYGLAKRILDGNVPDKLKDSKLYSIDVAGMLAGAKYRGDFEERLKAVLKHFEKEKAILFIDEIHTIIGAGTGGNGGMDASNILKPYLVDGKIKFIGATTYDEYSKYIEKDKALARRFQKIDVVEPTVEEAIVILEGLKEAYENYHKVTYTKDAIREAVELSHKYLKDRYLPDKAIDLLDDTGADFSIHPEKGFKVDRQDIIDNISKICKAVKVEAEKDEMESLRNLEKSLSDKVFGQDSAIEVLTKAIKLSKSGLGDEDKPIGSFLFVGPSGVGKTEIAKQLAKNLDIDFIRFDMSEYQEKHTVSKLVGAPAGYVGYDEGGLLTEAVRRTPHSVVLFDEIEKAHPDIFKTFLQIMDYGTLTDNKGRKADFRNAIIIMTSNAGATVATSKKVGFGSMNSDSNVNVDAINDAVKETFTPEFRNRLSKVIVFNGINDEMRNLIVNKELELFNEKLNKKNINAKYTKACIDELSKRGITSEYGAREVQRVINDSIKTLFVDAIIDGKNLGNVTVDYNGDEFILKETVKRTRKTKNNV